MIGAIAPIDPAAPTDQFPDQPAHRVERQDHAARRQRDERRDSGRAHHGDAVGPRIDSAELTLRARARVRHVRQRLGAPESGAAPGGAPLQQRPLVRRAALAGRPPLILPRAARRRRRGGCTNDEALRNFLYAQMKKTHDVAIEIVKLLYARPIRHSYYFGASQGGREALMVVQRYPQDYDGVFVQVPVFPCTSLNIFDAYSRAVSQAVDAWLPPAKVALVAKEVRRQCDALDGLADGLVSNYVGCNTRFDPSRTPDALDALRCPDGKDTGETCLSDAQIAAANAVHGPCAFLSLCATAGRRCPAGPPARNRRPTGKRNPRAPSRPLPSAGSIGAPHQGPERHHAVGGPGEVREGDSGLLRPGRRERS